MRTVLVTGANGFVGMPLCKRLSSDFKVLASVRNAHSLPFDCTVFPGATLGPNSNWTDLLSGADTVVHLAARVPSTDDGSKSLEREYHRINVEGTLNLARQAAENEVRRFVFLSSVKVNGEATLEGQAFVPGDVAMPQDAYGLSKLQAEEGLRQIAVESGMEVVVLRPPLVYGPAIKGNFAALMRWLKRGIPLPLGAVSHNRRSLVALDNLVDLIVTCIDHPAAANQNFLVSDGEDLSTADLLRRLGAVMGKPARLLPVPSALLMAGARLLGKCDMAQRLLGNLQVDMSHTCQTLSWKPPISVDEGLRRTVLGLK